MRIKSSLLLVVVVGALQGAFPAFAGDQVVTIETVPKGATVEQGGRVLGRTPLTLKYTGGYFQPGVTVWSDYLGAPLEFGFTLSGYQPKVVKLGRGPFPWRNLYGVVRYEYYLLDHSYRIELIPEKAVAVAQPVDQVTQLERLAALRTKGALTEEEFESAKARVLSAPLASVGTVEPTTAKPRNHLDDQDPAAFCWRLLEGVFPGGETITPRMPKLQVSTAVDGSDRQVSISCSWLLSTPRPAILSVEVACGDTSDPRALCSASGHPAGEGNPLCLWGTEAAARAVAQPGCLMAGSLAVDQRRSSPPGFENASTVDVREVLRTMAGRM